MITAYTGLPGHGKSYGVVENVIIPSLKSKRPVFTNIPMNQEHCLKVFGMQVNQFQTQEILDDETWFEREELKGAMVVIDEVWRLWPSGLKANNAIETHKSFLAEHRHLVGDNGLSTEVVLVTQDLSQIAAFAKALVEYTFRVTKHTKLGMNKAFRVDVYFGPVTGATPPISKRDREIHGTFKKSTYDLYKSHTKSEVGAGDESRTDKRFNALGRLSIKIGFAFVILASVFVFYGVDRVKDGYVSTSVPVVDIQPSNQDFIVEKPVYVKPTPQFTFLSKSETISIVWNNGHFPQVDFRFRVQFPKNEAVLTPADLKKLDYVVTPINECMVRIKGDDFNGFAMCPRENQSRGWVSELVASSGTNTQTTN